MSDEIDKVTTKDDKKVMERITKVWDMLKTIQCNKLLQELLMDKINGEIRFELNYCQPPEVPVVEIEDIPEFDISP